MHKTLKIHSSDTSMQVKAKQLLQLVLSTMQVLRFSYSRGIASESLGKCTNFMDKTVFKPKTCYRIWAPNSNMQSQLPMRGQLECIHWTLHQDRCIIRSGSIKLCAQQWMESHTISSHYNSPCTNNQWQTLRLVVEDLLLSSTVSC